MKKSICLLLLTMIFCAIVHAQSLNIATYNIRYDNKGDSVNGNGWKARYPVISQLIRFHDFDIFGVQEALDHQLQNLKDSLPGYEYIGVGRDDGKKAGEHAAIFYKTSKFRLLKKGDFWLSTITDRPNKGWDAALPRICSWGQFQVIGSSFKFHFFNIHFDHIGVQARKESAKLILAKIKEFAPHGNIILTGDFNVDQTNESYALLNNSGRLKDAYVLSPFKYALNGTFNSFNINAKTNSRIDHIFLSNSFKVKKYGILTDYYQGTVSAKSGKEDSGNFPKEVSLQKSEARLPSDHFPVMIQVNY